MRSLPIHYCFNFNPDYLIEFTLIFFIIISFGQVFIWPITFMNKPRIPSKEDADSIIWYFFNPTEKVIYIIIVEWSFCLNTFRQKNWYKLLKTRIKLSNINESCKSDFLVWKAAHFFNVNLYSIEIVSMLMQTHLYHCWYCWTIFLLSWAIFNNRNLDLTKFSLMWMNHKSESCMLIWPKFYTRLYYAHLDQCRYF